MTRIAKTTKETQIKQAVKDYLDLKGIFHYHNLQGIGSYKGLSDMAMHYKGQVHYLELKTPKGKLSPYQEVFQAQCQADDVPYHVIRTLDDIMEVVK